MYLQTLNEMGEEPRAVEGPNSPISSDEEVTESVSSVAGNDEEVVSESPVKSGDLLASSTPKDSPSTPLGSPMDGGNEANVALQSRFTERLSDCMRLKCDKTQLQPVLLASTMGNVCNNIPYTRGKARANKVEPAELWDSPKCKKSRELKSPVKEKVKCANETSWVKGTDGKECTLNKVEFFWKSYDATNHMLIHAICTNIPPPTLEWDDDMTEGDEQRSNMSVEEFISGLRVHEWKDGEPAQAQNVVNHASRFMFHVKNSRSACVYESCTELIREVLPKGPHTWDSLLLSILDYLKCLYNTETRYVRPKMELVLLL